MSRYIDADALLKKLPDDLPYKASVKRVLMQAPTADVVEVRHGEWVVHGTCKRENILMIGLICSECHFSIAKKVILDDEETMTKNYSYCPECGAWLDSTKAVAREEAEKALERSEG